MAHFAEIDENNIVLRVVVISDDKEYRGNDFLSNDLQLGGKWIQTSYNSYGGRRYNPETKKIINNNHFRYNYANPGFFYDEIRDAFIPPKPHPNATLNEETCLWEMPPEILLIENFLQDNYFAE